MLLWVLCASHCNESGFKCAGNFFSVYCRQKLNNGFVQEKLWKDLHWAIISVVLVIARSRLQYMADSKSDCWRGLCINEPLILVNSRKGETRSDLKESQQRTNRMDFAVTANRPSPSSRPNIKEQYEIFFFIFFIVPPFCSNWRMPHFVITLYY